MKVLTNMSILRKTDFKQMKLKKCLCTLSGDDWGIIKVCSTERQRNFALIGLFVLIIFLLCFGSSYFTFTKLFQSYWIGVPVGLFFAWMITNIYLLLLYTLTKNLLPHIKSKGGRFLSVALRLIFVWFIAIVVSKPLEVLLFAIPVGTEIETYKQEQLQRYTGITEQYFENEVKDLRAAIQQQLRLNNGVNTNEIVKENLLIQKRENEKIDLVLRMRELIDHSNYYVQSIIILNTKYPICWLISIFVMAVFTIPIYLKDFTPRNGLFYRRKEDIEITLIKEEYAQFKMRYSTLFQEIYNVKLEFAEPFEDPPFNTIRKVDTRRFQSQDTLLREIYDA